MTDVSSNKILLKNTIVLYVRMMVIMIIGLYTSRVVLNTLGVKDYGIYNVVGGVVAMFSILSSSLSNSISRFITYELGTDNIGHLKSLFSTSLNIQIGISAIIFFIVEFLGVWYVNEKMKIPLESLYAANWVLQFTIFSFILNIVSVPYNSLVIAHENMSFYSYISIFEAVSKLIIVICLQFSSFDKLILYAGLLFALTIIRLLILMIYCRKRYRESRYSFTFDKQLIKRIGSFTSWTLIGDSAWILNNQGVTIIINMFFNLTVNAARAIVIQVDTLIQQIVNSFAIAIGPQITKCYAQHDYKRMFKLVFWGGKLSAFCFCLAALPVFWEAEYLLKLWLGVVPEYTVMFLRIQLFSTFFFMLSNGQVTIIFATERIKSYELIVGSIAILALPLTYISFMMGGAPPFAYWIYLMINFLLFGGRIFMLKRSVDFPVCDFIRKVIFRVGLVIVVSQIIPVIVILTQSSSVYRFFVTCLVCCFFTSLSIYYLGLSQTERSQVISAIKSKICRD